MTKSVPQQYFESMRTVRSCLKVGINNLQQYRLAKEALAGVDTLNRNGQKHLDDINDRTDGLFSLIAEFARMVDTLPIFRQIRQASDSVLSRIPYNFESYGRDIERLESLVNSNKSTYEPELPLGIPSQG